MGALEGAIAPAAPEKPVFLDKKSDLSFKT